jgi:phosphoglycerate kinase
MLKTILEAPIVAGTRVLLRSNLNVPIDSGRITDTSRIFESLKTIQNLRERGAQIVIIAHLSDATASLRLVYDELTKHTPISFCDNLESIPNMKNGECVLLENIRHNAGEKKNDATFAKKLAHLGDIFINDDFSSAHREHASVVGVPQLIPGYMGLRFAEELENLSKAFEPAHPAVLILGGAKSETKLPIAISLSQTMDSVFVGGVSGNALLKASGRNVGQSVVGNVPHDVLKDALARGNIRMCTDVLVTDGDNDELVVSADSILDDNSVVDAGPESTAMIVAAVATAQFVLWNGPLGLYEEGHTTATHEVARAVAQSHAESIIGGGDTRAAIAALGVENDISFISSAGGAMLEFLANKTLPGIEALKNSA